MSLVLALLLGVVPSRLGDGGGDAAAITESAMVLHTYECRIRLSGKVSTTSVKASDAGQAKKLVQAQFGPSVTVLSVKKVD
jgi:hypothetical protein